MPAMQNAKDPQPSEPSEKAWLTPGRFALILVALIIAFFPDVLFAGKGFVFRDFGIFTFPNAFFQRECFWRGELPLWNPLNNTGIPFLAQWNTVCLYPLSLIYLLLPLTFGLSVFLLTHLFLAGFGMYLLASEWTGCRLAAGVAGIAFAFNGMILNCLMWSSNLAALALMPWVILLVERAWHNGGARAVAIAALISATQMLAGAPEIIVFTWLILFALWIDRWLRDSGTRRKIFVRVVAVGVLAALLSVVQLLPFLDLLAHSERTTSYGTSLWAISSWGWVNLFVPLFHCYRAPLGVYFQPGQDWTSSYYLGVGVLALSIVALRRAGNIRVWLLVLFAVFGFVIALGDPGHLYPLLLKGFPPLGFMRYPIKFLFLTVFCVPLLAGYAVKQIAGGISGNETPVNKTALVIPAVFITTIVAILWYARLHPFPYEDWNVLCENGGVRILFILLIFSALMYYRRIHNLRHQTITGLALLALVWLDAVTHAPRQNPAVDAGAFQSGLVTQQMHPPPQSGDSRAFMTEQSHNLLYGSMLTEPYKDYLGRRCGLFGDCNLLDNIPEADGFYSLYIKEQRGLFEKFFFAPTNDFPAGYADFLGISQISDPQKILSWQFRSSFQPFLSLGAQPEFVELSNTPALLLSKDFDPRKTVYLPPETQAQLKGIGETHGSIHQVHVSAQRVDADVEADSASILVLSQTFYHPWQAAIDGQIVSILRANYAFQAVPIPAGTHHVELVYRDRRFQLGLCISLATLAGCLMLVFAGSVNGQKGHAQQP